MIVKDIFNFGNNRLFFVESVLENTLANKLQTLFDLDQPGWSNDGFVHTPGRIQNISQVPVVIETEIYARNILTPMVSNALAKPVKFVGLSFWWDSEGFNVSKHVDLPGINYALQLYLESPGDKSKTLGTAFYNDTMDLIIRAPYKHNTGYLLENPWAVPHGLDVVVPPGHDRKSLYLRFTDI